ncbi:insulinase family protein [Bacteroidales bacterium OttesenSCG-928-I21]|nr:insulinase family protein [Bacteroidales bacterium OttesenSCG-928-I21]
MKKLTLLLLSIFMSFVYMFGQNLELTDKLPTDPKVLTGTMKNGMKYYIRSNAIPEKRAELTLVVNAGSVLEDEDQQGLAHFVEHMAFNGTKNFPENELVSYLESLGMKFGPEVNAYTSLDETVYGIKVPTDSVEYVDKGLLVLYDWASQLTLDTEQIDAERGVIHEEWRMSQGAMNRMQEKYIKALLNNSRYAERMPIGKMEVVDNCDPDVLRRFYYDWYRPDLMAVVIVGDFDAKEMEKKIIDLFGTIKPHANPRERVYTSIPDNDELIVAVASDPESPISAVQMFYKRPMKQMHTVGDYREKMVEALLSMMISSRLQELTLQEDPPFAYAGAAISEFIGPIDVYMSIGMIQNNDVNKTLSALTRENKRMTEFGFTETELEREKISLLKMVEKQYNERDKQKSETYVNEYKSNYLFPHTPYPGIEFENEMYKKYVPTISLEEINTFAKTIVTDKNAVIVVMMPEKEGVVVPTEHVVAKMYETALSQTVEPYVDKVIDKPLIASLPPKGKVSKVLKNKDLDYETWILKNGIKVVLKQTNFKDDEILFYAKSQGGYSVYEQKDDVSARIASSVAYESGLGGFDKAELQKYLAGKTVNLHPFIGEISEGFSGNSSIQDFETLLELIHSSFAQPKTTETAFISYINKEKGMLENSALSPESAWQDSLSWILSDYHPRRRPMSAKLLEEADYKRIRYIYNQRFNDPKNFTFYFVGNIDKKAAKPLIEKYLGSLSGVDRTEVFSDLGVRPPQGKIEKAIHKGKDDKCMELIVFNGEMTYSAQNILDLQAFCEILSTQLLEEIREKESGVYTISAHPSFSKEPYPRYNVTIFFSCDPGREKELSAKIMNVIKSLQTNGISDADIKKVIEKQKRQLETRVKENSYWRNLLIQIEEKEMSIEEYKNYPQMIENITVESMKSTANKFLNMNNYVKVYLMPEK